MLILAGDIGGTHTRLGFFEKGQLVGEEQKFPSRHYTGLEEIVREFLQLEKRKVSKACFGVAGPIQNGKCKTTNLPWIVDADRISQTVQIPEVYLINDLEANAYGISVLKPESLFLLHPGKRQEGNRALISAGTGLGEAGLYWDGKKHRPIASEGGHCDFAPRNALEIDLLLYLKKKFGHVSWERVVSGPGLYTLFQFLVETDRGSVSSGVQNDMKSKDPSRVVSEWGSANKDPVCAQAVDWFISLYGAEAGNLALKFLSVGGLYIGGGIAPHLIEKIKKSSFVSSFMDKGRFSSLLDGIPIWIILNDDTALLGAANYVENK